MSVDGKRKGSVTFDIYPVMHRSVIIFEDNRSFREDLTQLFQTSPDYLMLGAFENCAEVAKQVQEFRPDVILMDIEMPVVDGIQGVQLIRAFDPKVPIIMLTAFDDSNHIFEAICAGASGYLTKSTPPDKIFSAITEVIQGGAPMSPVIAAKTLQLLAQQKSTTDYQLTAKETDILKLLVAGNSYKMIASELDITRETVKTHIRNIYEKLQVHSCTEAVSKALRERIV